MNKEQTIEAAKVMLAWAEEGKQVEYHDKASKTGWVTVIDNVPLWDWCVSEYRIKPEPTYRPFKSAEEVMEAIKEHGDWVIWKQDGVRYKIVAVGDGCITPYYDVSYSFGESLGEFRFLDGTPFGKLVEE